MLIQIENITKTYEKEPNRVIALNNVSFSLVEGEMVYILGPSGSGKSTLLHIIGCIDSSTSGRYLLEGLNVGSLEEDELAKIRNQKIGFVFQMFYLLPSLSALKNVELPLFYAGYSAEARKKMAYNALGAVNLEERATHRPNELSGGEQQRVAIARALVNKPKIILADEPTGNLDSHSGKEIMRIFKDLNKKGVSIILVTHNETILSSAHRILKIEDGKVVSQ